MIMRPETLDRGLIPLVETSRLSLPEVAKPSNQRIGVSGRIGDSLSGGLGEMMAIRSFKVDNRFTTIPAGHVPDQVSLTISPASCSSNDLGFADTKGDKARSPQGGPQRET